CAKPTVRSFPTRRSSDLLVEVDVIGLLLEDVTLHFGNHGEVLLRASAVARDLEADDGIAVAAAAHHLGELLGFDLDAERFGALADRKSTRLNSSHVAISY